MPLTWTNEDLERYRTMPKRVTNPGARWLEKPKARPVQRQRTFRVRTEEEPRIRFALYERQNLLDECDFSCGIVLLWPPSEPLTLARYNGPSHEHGDIRYRPHIHRATEEAILSGGKPERMAFETKRFGSLAGALACLLEDFSISGLDSPSSEQMQLLLDGRDPVDDP